MNTHTSLTAFITLACVAVAPNRAFADGPHPHGHCEVIPWEETVSGDVMVGGADINFDTSFFYGTPPAPGNMDCTYEVTDLQSISFALYNEDDDPVGGTIHFAEGDWTGGLDSIFSNFQFGPEALFNSTIGNPEGEPNLSWQAHPDGFFHLDIRMPYISAHVDSPPFRVSISSMVDENVTRAEMTMSGAHYYVPAPGTAATAALVGLIAVRRRRE